MKKSTIITSVFLIIIFVSQGCKRYKDKDLYGTWYASIDSTDACGYNKVIIEFDKNDIAYLNYSGSNGNKWNPSYQCKWWIKKEKDTVNSIDKKQWFLYILRFDTLSDVCYPNAFSSNYNVIFPDTTQYILENLDDSSLKLELVRKGFTEHDLLFSVAACTWFCTPEKKLNRD